MRFYDLGNDLNKLASPYCMCMPENDTKLLYKNGMVFGVTDAGRCVFGTNGERHHEQLQMKDGENLALRGVFWVNESVMALWQTFYSMGEFKDLMRTLAGGVSKELGINPGGIVLFLGYSFPSDTPGEYRFFNVSMTLTEAAGLNANGDCEKYFIQQFKKDMEMKKNMGSGTFGRNGMLDRDMWRHYEVVGEGKQTVRLTGKDLRTMIQEAVRRVINETPGYPLMNMTGRRISTNVEDRRAEEPDFVDYICGTMHQISLIGLMAAGKGDENSFKQFMDDPEVANGIQQVQAEYQKAKQFMGTFKQRTGIRLQNGINRAKSNMQIIRKRVGNALNENTQYGITMTANYMKKLFASCVSYFKKMVDSYIQAVQGGRMNPGRAFRDIGASFSFPLFFITVKPPLDGPLDIVVGI